MQMLVFSDPAVTGYGAPGHPETPARVSRSAERLSSAGLRPRAPDFELRDEDILAVHSAGHVSSLKNGDYEDPDTAAHPGISDIARISLAGALSAMSAALKGTPAFSLMRPPGHHAGKNRIAGFCYLNNVAIATLRALREKGVRKVAILDIDVHHGDGTQDIMLGRDDVRFCSLHQVPLYPGTGLSSSGNCRNIPLEAGTAEDGYMRRLEPALADLLDFKPDLLAISAGFDTYKDCPIAGLKLGLKSYRRIGRLVAETGLRRFAVLEGGYADALPECIEEFLQGFAG